MKNNKNPSIWRRGLALLLAVCLAAGYVPVPTHAEGCAHEHGEECYEVMTQCVHVHDESCWSDPALMDAGAEADACAHVCTEETGCVTKALNCAHVHDGACGEEAPTEPAEETEATEEETTEATEEETEPTEVQTLEEPAGEAAVFAAEGSEDVAMLEVGEEVTYYTSLNEAIDAATAAGTGTVTLLDDAALENSPDEDDFWYTGVGTNLTIVLDGHTLTGSFKSLSGNVHMTIDGTKPGSTFSGAILFSVKGGVLTINGGTYQNKTGDYALYVAGRAQLNITAGEFKNRLQFSCSWDSENGGYTPLNVTGGTFCGITNDGGDETLGATLTLCRKAPYCFTENGQKVQLSDLGLTTDKTLTVEKCTEHTYDENQLDCIYCGQRNPTQAPAGTVATVDGQFYSDILKAIQAANTSGMPVVLFDDCRLPDGVGLQLDGYTVTVDLNGKNLIVESGSPLQVLSGDVTLMNSQTAGKVTVGGNSGSAIQVRGGSLTVKENVQVEGVSYGGYVYPAIEVTGGTVTVHRGATLVHGIQAPDGHTAAEYLAEGSAYAVNGQVTNGYVQSTTDTLEVVEHGGHVFLSTGSCACGLSCDHGTVDQTTGICETCGAALYDALVTMGETKEFYESLATALTAAKQYGKDCTVLILRDVTGTSFYLAQNVTVDGGGHTVKGCWYNPAGKISNITLLPNASHCNYSLDVSSVDDQGKVFGENCSIQSAVFARGYDSRYAGILQDGFAFFTDEARTTFAEMGTYNFDQLYTGRHSHDFQNWTTNVCQDCGYTFNVRYTKKDGTTAVYYLSHNAVEDANISGGTLTYFGLGNYSGDITNDLTFELNGHQLYVGTVWIQSGTTVIQNGTVYGGNGTKLKVNGGNLVLEQGAIVQAGGSGPAVQVLSGSLTLKEGTVLQGGIKAQSGHTIGEYLAPSTAYAVYDAATGKAADPLTLVDCGTEENLGDLVVVAHTHRMDENNKCQDCGYVCAHTTVDMTTGLCAACGIRRFEAKIGDQGYATLDGALDAAAKSNDGSTVTMLCGTVELISLPGGRYVLDLNGQTTWGFRGTNKDADVTIKSSKPDVEIAPGYANNFGSGTYTIECGSWKKEIVVGSATLNVHSGEFVNIQCNASSNIAISGGTFDAVFSNFTKAVYNFLAPGYAFYDSTSKKIVDGSGGYLAYVYVAPHTHDFTEKSTCDCGVGAAASVTAADGKITYYGSIADAIAAAKAASGTTVTLLDNINETIDDGGQNFTLDLNGKTLAKLELSGDSFTLLDSQQTGTISEFRTPSGSMVYAYLKEGWCLVRGGACLEPTTTVNAVGPFQVEFSGAKDITWPKKASLAYGLQKFPCGLGFSLEDPTEVVSAQLSWTFADAPRSAIGPTEYLTKGSDGSYSSTSSGNLTTNLLDFDRLIPGNTYGILATVTLTRKDGSVRKFAVPAELGVDKGHLGLAKITLDSTALTFAPDTQTAAGQQQSVTVTSVVLGSKTLVEGTDYEVTGNTGTNAGTYTLTVKAKEDSPYYTGDQFVNWEIMPLDVNVEDSSLPGKVYDGTAAAQVPVLTVTGGILFRENTDYILKKAEFVGGPNVGTQPIRFQVELTGDAAKNYQLTQSEFEIPSEITPATPSAPTVGTLTVTNGNVTGYTLENLEGLLAPLTDPCTYGTITYGTPSVAPVTGYAMTAAIENGALKLDVTGTGDTVGQVATVTVPVRSQNYGDITLTVNVGAVPPVPQVLSFADTAVTKTYGDAPFVNALTHSVGDGQISYSSSDPAVATVDVDGTVTVRGAGTAKITATAAKTLNYGETSVSFDLTVAKAAGTLTDKNYPLDYTYGDSIPTPSRETFETNSTGALTYRWEPSEPLNAGTYQLTVTVEGDNNHTEASWTRLVTVKKSVWSSPSVSIDHHETVAGKKDGAVTLVYPAAMLEYRVKGAAEYSPVPASASATYTTVSSLAPGTYEFRVKETENYFASAPSEVIIQAGRMLAVTLPSPQTGYTLTADKVELSWQDSLTLTLTVEEGYYKTASFAVKAGDQVLTEENGTFALTNVEADVVITLEGLEKDQTAPSLTLWNWVFGQGVFQGTASRKDWTNISTSTAPYYILTANGNYFTVDASDGETGLTGVYYLLSSTALTQEALEKAAWEPVPEGSLNQGKPVQEQMIQLDLGEWYFYLKAVDRGGNAAYVGSPKLIREENAPVFSGVTDGATYYTTQKVTITDDYALVRYLAPGSKNWKDISGTAYEVTLEGNKEESYTMEVEDACRNTSTLTVYMQPISALTEDIRSLTAENIEKSDLDQLNQAESALSALDTTYATEEEKQTIQTELARITALKRVLEDAAQVEAIIAALPDSAEPWDAEAEKNVKAARAAYDTLTDHQKTLVDDSKLTKLEGQLVDYRFTSGENQTWTLGSGKDLTFCVNGQLGKVKEVLLNGQAVDTEKTAQAKGTDFTLKASYLQGLNAGSYTLQVVFVDGQTPETTVTVIKGSHSGKAVDSVQNETVFGKNDGLVRLSAPAESCEYRVKGETDYQDIPGDPQGKELGLTPGTYEFRLKETRDYEASPAETVTVEAGRKLTVTLPEPQNGYTLTADKMELSWQDSLTLTLTLAHQYYRTDSFALKAGGQVLTEANGTFVLTNVEADVVITLEGLEKDENAPTVTGITEGATYYTTQEATVTDDGKLVSAELQGVAGMIVGNKATLTLPGNQAAAYEITAIDAAGNRTTVTVTMQPISALTEDIQSLTAENIEKANLDRLNQAESALGALDTTNATEEEKQTIQTELARIAALKRVLEEAAQVEARIAALPDSAEPWDAEAEKDIKAARAAYEALTEHQKTLVDDSKLTKLEAQLVDYRFTSGENQTWTLGSGKDLTFCVNGQLGKVKEVLLNGQAVDTEKTAQAKGTDFTLKASSLQSLSAGSYTLQVVFVDGQTPETQITVTVSPNYLDLSAYPEFTGDETVTVDGRTYPIGTDGGCYVNLPETGDILQRFTYLDGSYSAAHENYPVGMSAYRIHRQEGGATLEPISALDDLLVYSGCSIRISGKQGIRMITGITQENKKALTSKDGLAGYTLEEYGTLICWNTDVTSGDDFSLDMSCARHNYAYLKGKADPVFGKENGKMLYTNVLVGFSLEDCGKDLILRPYIKLKDTATGETVTLYGGSVCRSIGYIAMQNADTYKPGTPGYKYVHKIIDAVYGED